MPLVSMFKGDPNLGSVNQYVMLLQRFLVMNGVLDRTVPTDPDPVNGKFDDATESAVKSFQKVRGVPISGIVKGQTWAAIAGVSYDLAFVDPTNPTDPSTKEFPLLRYDDRDSVVTVLQRLLFEYSIQPNQEFIPKGIINQQDVEHSHGSFSDKTKQAVESFQANRSIQIDGEVGPDTWEKLLFPKGRH